MTACPPSPPPPSAPSSLGRARAGDPLAWAELHRLYDGLVTATARRAGLSDEECRDASQVTWLRLLEHLDRIREDAALPAWLATTVRREAWRTARRRRREQPCDRDDLADRGGATDGDHVEDVVEHRLLLRDVRRAVAALPPRERRLVEALLDPAPRSYAELGTLLGMPVGAIGPVRQRAVAHLRTQLCPA